MILDVVYNHTAEGNHFGPMFSFKGADNLGYYKVVEGDERYPVHQLTSPPHPPSFLHSLHILLKWNDTLTAFKILLRLHRMRKLTER